MTQPENRHYQRMQFFRLPKEQEFIPVWVFNSNKPGQTLAGLVVNMSETGIQVLTAMNEQPDDQHYEITFLDDDHPSGNAQAIVPFRIRYVWSESEQGLYTRSGFSFDALDDITIRTLFERMRNGEHAFLRCALEPLDH